MTLLMLLCSKGFYWTQALTKLFGFFSPGKPHLCCLTFLLAPCMCEQDKVSVIAYMIVNADLN